MQKFASVSAYLKSQPPPARRVLTQLRALIKKAAKVEEVISYGIPGYKMNGRTGVFFAGWKDHFSLYPTTAGVRAVLGKQLAKYQAGKGTLQFAYDEKLPAALITKMVKVRAAEANALPAPKKKKKTSR